MPSALRRASLAGAWPSPRPKLNETARDGSVDTLLPPLLWGPDSGGRAFGVTPPDAGGAAVAEVAPERVLSVVRQLEAADPGVWAVEATDWQPGVCPPPPGEVP